MYGMRGHPSVPAPDLKFSQVAGVFGNLSLAYGAGVVIPALQRQHSDPKRMPRVVFFTITLISILFLVLASTAYSSVGCQISGNLLFSIYPDADTGLTTLGFKSSWGAVVLAYLFMQLHVTIAFSVLLNPPFYLAERLVLGMHKKKEGDIENAITYADASTPAKDSIANPSVNVSERRSKMSYMSVADAENPHFGDEDAAEYRGANAINIILPIVFLLKKCWSSIPMYEKIPALAVVIVCSILGCYVTYTSGKTLFSPTESDVEFPYCDSEFENKVYYNYTAVHGA
ncbi:hypothetical protein PI124_g24126 [Phytophthora idaei]|nr:hypothetical protein PI126_g24198 [Phytophthora idaei]KAG3230776.1 hypothetical protein PI124_g24126 [Phytophthora idaei]